MKKFCSYFLILSIVLLFLNCASSLTRAASEGDVHKVDEILNSGADINETTISDETALMSAVSHKKINVVKFLINKGAYLNAQDMMGNTALHLAIKNNDPEIVKLLVEGGASIHVPDYNDSLTPEQVADYKGNLQIIEIMKLAEPEETTVNNVAANDIKPDSELVQVGIINALDTAKREVLVSTNRTLKIGEIVCIEHEGKRIIMSASYPMMTSSVCQLKGDYKKYFIELKKGMSVFRFKSVSRRAKD